MRHELGYILGQNYDLFVSICVCVYDVYMSYATATLYACSYWVKILTFNVTILHFRSDAAV